MDSKYQTNEYRILKILAKLVTNNINQQVQIPQIVVVDQHSSEKNAEDALQKLEKEGLVIMRHQPPTLLIQITQNGVNLAKELETNI